MGFVIGMTRSSEYYLAPQLQDAPGRADVIARNALLELPNAVRSLTLMSKAAEPGPTPGAPGSTTYWTWLNVLKLSSRNCRFKRSYSCRFFIRPTSKLLILVWRRRLRLLFPNCPGKRLRES